jgi:hypothetical protein
MRGCRPKEDAVGCDELREGLQVKHSSRGVSIVATVGVWLTVNLDDLGRKLAFWKWRSEYSNRTFLLVQCNYHGVLPCRCSIAIVN